MYNTVMLRLNAFLILSLLAGGCAVTTNYDPLKAANNQTLLLNESLKQVNVGMSQTDVHNLMGQELIIGYSYQNPLPGESSPLAVVKEASEKPITIPNPYKSEPRGECSVEYYVTAIHHPDGVISDDELMPLLFCKGSLKAKGWDHLK
jgi:hypothetical protein